MHEEDYLCDVGMRIEIVRPEFTDTTQDDDQSFKHDKNRWISPSAIGYLPC